MTGFEARPSPFSCLVTFLPAGTGSTSSDRKIVAITVNERPTWNVTRPLIH